MPKQESIIKIRGKMDNQSYYYTRNGGYQVRKINPTMSERVKTEEAFVNTRKNAAEFGAAALSANQMIGAISTRWRYLLKPNIGGYMTKFIYDLMKRDATSPWGQRQVQDADKPLIQQEYSKLSKNPMHPHVKWIMDSQIYLDDSLSTPTVYTTREYNTTEEFEDYYLNRGADAVRLIFYAFNSGVPKWDTDHFNVVSPYILPYDLTCTFLVKLERGTVHRFVNEFTIGEPVIPSNAAGHCGGILGVLYPLKLVGGTSLLPREFILQHLCSAYWVEPTERAMI